MMNIFRKDPGLATDSFYEIRAGCTDVPDTKFRIKGIHPSIRGEVWEFLLGCYDSKSTFDEREEIRHKRREAYAELKESCSHMFPVVGSGKFVTARVITSNGEPVQDPIVLLGTKHDDLATPQDEESVDLSAAPMVTREHDKEVIQWKLALHQIGLDVVRTDRTLVFYEKQENLAKLWDVLAVYAWHDKDVGYGQGMSDLCSPMIMLFEHEADAFWCFERLMRRVRGNFRCTGNTLGVEAQLDNLANVTQLVIPKLHRHLEHLGGGGYLFAFRMLMVLFRRELSFGDSLYLWEMLWALEYDPELFTLYEGGETHVHKITRKARRQYGKYERANRRSRARARGGPGSTAPFSIFVFLVASVLKDRSDKLLKEARGLDDVVKILNDVSGNMDARKACIGAMKIHKKYLRRQKNQ
ncbi:rab GTPase-activating protein 22-like isoform X2 [Rutidosis leptorrhynchoides]|uniref:rab GTPase-activating protein 22-like isoform X2 n=1 Tax=Rutidosis leptorrhynchoides TaxID=125765 RepID=UPI003A9A463F